MQSFVRGIAPGLLVLLIGAGPVVSAQAQGAEGFQAEVNALADVAAQKFIGLAEALNAEQYAWRPAEGVRSTAEVLLHIAGNNYWIPIQMGCMPPEGVPITAAYASVDAFEKQTDRVQILAVVRDAFAHVRKCIEGVPGEMLAREMDIFGTPGNGRSYLLVLTTHMHEHLGQLIAYARMNGVVPPWNR